MKMSGIDKERGGETSDNKSLMFLNESLNQLTKGC